MKQDGAERGKAELIASVVGEEVEGSEEEREEERAMVGAFPPVLLPTTATLSEGEGEEEEKEQELEREREDNEPTVIKLCSRTI